MEYIKLGKTGLKVSVACLGCGGSSTIGKSTGKTENQSNSPNNSWTIWGSAT